MYRWTIIFLLSCVILSSAKIVNYKAKNKYSDLEPRSSFLSSDAASKLFFRDFDEYGLWVMDLDRDGLNDVKLRVGTVEENMEFDTLHGFRIRRYKNRQRQIQALYKAFPTLRLSMLMSDLTPLPTTVTSTLSNKQPSSEAPMKELLSKMPSSKKPIADISTSMPSTKLSKHSISKKLRYSMQNKKILSSVKPEKPLPSSESPILSSERSTYLPSSEKPSISSSKPLSSTLPNEKFTSSVAPSLEKPSTYLPNSESPSISSSKSISSTLPSEELPSAVKPSSGKRSTLQMPSSTEPNLEASSFRPKSRQFDIFWKSPKNDDEEGIKNEIMRIVNKFVLSAHAMPTSNKAIGDTNDNEEPSLTLYFKGPYTALTVRYNGNAWHYFITPPSPLPKWFYEKLPDTIPKGPAMYVKPPKDVVTEFYKAFLSMVQSFLGFPV